MSDTADPKTFLALLAAHAAQAAKAKTSLAPPQSISSLIKKYSFDVHDRFYIGQTLHLDGYSFTNCGFKNCTLVTNTGVFTIESCTFIGCSVQFGADAMRILKLFHLFSGTGAGFPAFSAQKTLDGSVTIR
jgi:hypothetical protein